MRGVERIKHVSDAELADREHQSVGAARSCKLIDVAFHLFGFAWKVDRLADEISREPRIGNGSPHLVGFTTGKAGDAQRAAEAKALVDLRVDPEFSARPEPEARIERDVEGLAALVRDKAVCTPVR